MRLALTLVLTALAAFVVNFLGATGGHCDDSGCSGDHTQHSIATVCFVVVVVVVVIIIVGGECDE